MDRACIRRPGRQAQPDEVDQLVERIDAATSTPEFLEAELAVDCDSALHRAVNIGMFRTVGMDSPLAETLYELDSILNVTPSIQISSRSFGVCATLISASLS